MKCAQSFFKELDRTHSKLVNKLRARSTFCRQMSFVRHKVFDSRMSCCKSATSPQSSSRDIAQAPTARRFRRQSSGPAVPRGPS